jgi:hypothetical protein
MAAKKIAPAANDLAISSAMAVFLADETWNHRCDPPLEFHELDAAIASGHASAENPFGWIALPVPADVFCRGLIGEPDTDNADIETRADDSEIESFSDLLASDPPPVEELVPGLIEKGIANFLSGGEEVTNLVSECRLAFKLTTDSRC